MSAAISAVSIFSGPGRQAMWQDFTHNPNKAPKDQGHYVEINRSLFYA